MNSSFTSKKAISIYILIGSILIFLRFMQWMLPFIPDDAYISFRYAENLAKGDGLTFNPGEAPVEGYSNFLWVLLCSILARFGLDVPYWASKIGILFGILNIILFWLILQRRVGYGWHLVVPLILFASSGPFLLYAVSGMETPLFSLLLLAAVYSAYCALSTTGLWWYVLFSIVSVLLSLCRPEGIIIFPTIAGCIIWFKRSFERNNPRPLLKPLVIASLIFVIPLLAYNIWRIQYFGSLLTPPFLSKLAGGGSLMYGWYINLYCFLIRHNYYFTPFGYYYGAITLIAIVAVSFQGHKKPELIIERISLILAIVFMVLYMNFIDGMPGMRYHSALIGLLLVPFGIFTKEALYQKTERALRFSDGIRYSIICLAILAISLFGAMEVSYDGQRWEKSLRSSAIPLGKWLKANIPSNALSAINDVGAIPYYSGLRTMDFYPFSVLDPHIAKYGFSNEYFFSRDPDIVVIVSFSLSEPKFFPQHQELFNDPRFLERYRLIGITRYDWFFDRCYWTYARHNMKFSDEQMKSFPKGIHMNYHYD